MRVARNLGRPQSWMVCRSYKNWLVVSTNLKNMKVNWDDELPIASQYMGKKNVPNHRPEKWSTSVPRIKSKSTTARLSGEESLLAKFISVKLSRTTQRNVNHTPLQESMCIERIRIHTQTNEIVTVHISDILGLKTVGSVWRWNHWKSHASNPGVMNESR